MRVPLRICLLTVAMVAFSSQAIRAEGWPGTTEAAKLKLVRYSYLYERVRLTGVGSPADQAEWSSMHRQLIFEANFKQPRRGRVLDALATRVTLQLGDWLASSVEALGRSVATPNGRSETKSWKDRLRRILTMHSDLLEMQGRHAGSGIGGVGRTYYYTHYRGQQERFYNARLMSAPAKRPSDSGGRSSGDLVVRAHDRAWAVAELKHMRGQITPARMKSLRSIARGEWSKIVKPVLAIQELYGASTKRGSATDCSRLTDPELWRLVEATRATLMIGLILDWGHAPSVGSPR